MTLKKWITVSLMLLLSATSSASADSVQLPLSVAELNEKAASEGTFSVRAYVVKQFTCPPCPAGTHCKPCMGDHIVVSDTRKRSIMFPLTREDAVFFVNDPDFDFQTFYVFEINVSPFHSSWTGHPHDFVVRRYSRTSSARGDQRGP